MYAIIATGGKQYKVAEGDVIRVEKLGAEAGETVTFDQVLAVSNETVRQRKLSFTSIREKPDTTRKTVTDSSLLK